MKKIELRPMGIAAILLLCAVYCQAQEFDGVKKDTTKWKDTVSVVLLVCDTLQINSHVYWVRAYSVRNAEYELVDVSVNPNTLTYVGGGVYSITLIGWSPIWENKAVYTHSEYLDNKRKPLPKSIVVWQIVSK